ncbi:MAG TPA: carbonic anhydrase family protein [Casimicrobiaceae bacterium]|nr:carbonic anhydrase family protein [Casimicrobiaceae bacterium]
MKNSLARILAVVAAAALVSAAPRGFAAELGSWSYAGATGPAKWAALSKDFKSCKAGEESKQSPIDIPDAKARKGDLPGLLFNYKTVPLKVVDNGHTVEVVYPPGSFVSIDGKHYELQQFHFHKPAEEKIDGKGHDMDAHLVHKGPDGKLMVIAVLLDAGKENKLIKAVWDNLPKEKGKEVSVDAVKISALDLLPNDKGYYTYAGSLTTPPCSEQVTWYVLKLPVQISADEIAHFGRLYPMNARPIQPFNDRDIMGTR